MRISTFGMIERQRRTSWIKNTIGFFLILISITVIALTIEWNDVSVHTDSLQKNKVDLFPEVSCSIKCPRTSPNKPKFSSSSESCPEYFRWIHEDLRPWKDTGITRKMVERAREVAHFRIVIVNGRVYFEKYKPTFQKRDMVTLWGILQLLSFYPGVLPDLDIVFECGDQPVTQKSDYGKSKDSIPPPLFHYCGNDSSFDIVFPDWSFWGWPELNIKPWDILKKDLQQSNEMIKWTEREPYAYWKGNALLSQSRRDLLKCNVSKNQDWNARIYDMVRYIGSLNALNSCYARGLEKGQNTLSIQWVRERRQGYKTSDLATQCTHRYKIYVEGLAWSVSQKYILACDSVALLINPHYYDFFTRSLLPTVHYWPINENDKCKSIKFAVDWGNKNAEKAQEIGKSGSRFVHEELQMKYIYDYMFHLLSEYAKLLKYRPTVPREAVEVCSDTLICSTKGIRKKFRVHSRVNNASSSKPCSMAPPWSPADLQNFLERKENLTKQVEQWEETQSV